MITRVLWQDCLSQAAWSWSNSLYQPHRLWAIVLGPRTDNVMVIKISLHLHKHWVGELVRASKKSHIPSQSWCLGCSMTGNARQKWKKTPPISELNLNMRDTGEIFTSLNFVLIVKLAYYTSLKLNLQESSYLEFVWIMYYSVRRKL